MSIFISEMTTVTASMDLYFLFLEICVFVLLKTILPKKLKWQLIFLFNFFLWKKNFFVKFFFSSQIEKIGKKIKIEIKILIWFISIEKIIFFQILNKFLNSFIFRRKRLQFLNINFDIIIFNHESTFKYN